MCTTRRSTSRATPIAGLEREPREPPASWPAHSEELSPGSLKKMDHGRASTSGSLGPAELPIVMMSRRRRTSLLRSEPMVMLQLIVQADSCAETVEELGELGAVMFCDLNEGATAFQRNFVSQMRDCDEVERCLRYIGDQVAAAP